MFARLALARTARVSMARALHTSRPALSDAAASAKTYGSGPKDFDKLNPANLYKTIDRANTHVLEKPSITTWQEVSEGGAEQALSIRIFHAPCA